MRKRKYDAEIDQQIKKRILEELEIFQKEVDDRFSYVSVARREIACYPERYIGKKNDVMLVRFQLSLSSKSNRGNGYLYYLGIHFYFIDLYLHPEDKNKSGYEKFNTIQLRPTEGKEAKDNLRISLEEHEATKFIHYRYRAIYSKIIEEAKEQYGVDVRFSATYNDHRYYYDQQGKPEQYMEYFCNITKLYPEFVEIYKRDAREIFGLEMTDEDIKNCRFVEDIFGVGFKGKSRNVLKNAKEEKKQVVDHPQDKKENDSSKSKSTKTDIATKKQSKQEFKFSKKEKPRKKLIGGNFKLTLWDVLLEILPVLVMIGYVIIAATGVMKNLHLVVGFDATLFGYHFEISSFALDWFEHTDHNFFTAISLGLLQIVFIAVGFVLDLVLHLIFFILAVIWLLIRTVLAFGFYYVFPVAIPVWLLINVFRVEPNKRIFAIICLLISIACCIYYFVACVPIWKERPGL